MASNTLGKRTAELLDGLWDLQKHDQSPSSTTWTEAKFLLRNNSACICIEVTTPKPRTNIVDPTPFNLGDQEIPEFINCQLVDQKLIDSRNYQDTIALPAILSVISLIYAGPSTGKVKTFPTVFRWNCSRTHRTHILFAHTDVKMRSKVYSVDELLNLKNSTSPNLAAAVAVRDNDLSEMLRAKSRVSSRSYNASSIRRPSKRTTDECSTTSEEIVFKGTNRRASKPNVQTVEPAQASRTTNHAAPDSQLDIAAASICEADQPTEWRYRGRTGSELLITEPLPAPVGLQAQQNEGFQRFYKAVVSPTHVRVTAGGRIVPNTRNPISPTAKRPREGEAAASDAQPEPVRVSAAVTAAAANKQHMPVMSMPHPMQFFYPAFHPGVSAIHPVTGMPIPMMPPSYPMPMPVPNAATAPAAPPAAMQEASFKENQAKNNDGREVAATIAGAAKTGVKLSPPEQFDHSRPFMYNGQPWMFPMFPPPFPGFMGMPPPPGFAGPPLAGPPMMMPPQMAMAPMMGPAGLMGPQPPLGATFPAVTNTGTTMAHQTTVQPPSKPPISSIRPSEISRKQIEGLRASLKYHEDQVEYNKHQIDEKLMEDKIRHLKSEIARFTELVEKQVAYEAEAYPKIEKVKEDVSSSGSRSSMPSTKTSQSQSEESKESKATTATMTSQPGMSKKERARTMVGINSTKSCNASYEYEDTGERFVHDPNKRSKLPSDAALAPVFQPRSVSAFTAPAAASSHQDKKTWSSPGPDEEITQEQLKAMEQSLVAVGSKALKLSQHVQEQLSAEASHQERSPRSHNTLGMPYLVGTLPRGVNPYASHRIEYEYSRRLTDEELEARQSYWGKGSRSTAKGLPKYDGKNFYPPSPFKDTVPSETLMKGFQRGQDVTSENEAGKCTPVMRDIDPFCAVTPNNSLSMSEDRKVGSNQKSVKSTKSFASQVASASDEFEKALAETNSEDAESEMTHSKDVSETRSADYHDTRTNGTSSRLWKTMLKRGLTSSDVLPSTVSSTTAHGYLPQYTDQAVLSMSPELSGTVTSTTHGSPSKHNEVDTNGTSTFMVQKAPENYPPATAERLSETLLNMVGMKAPAWAN